MQFDVHEYSVQGYCSFIVLVQSDIVDTPGYQMAIPLASDEDFSVTFTKDLFPAIIIDGTRYRLLTPDLASVSERKIGDLVSNIANYENDIKDALNLLFWGT